MTGRTFVCGVCGRARRRVERGFPHVPSSPWPRCCDTDMLALHHTQAAGSAKMTPAQRLVWLALGARLLKRRKHGSHKWVPVMSTKQAARRDAEIVDADKRRWRQPGPEEKKWKQQGHRKKHAKKKDRPS